MKEIRKTVLREVENNYEEMVTTLQKLVRIPSIVGSEGEAQKFVAGVMKEIGLEVELFEANREEVSQHPAYIETPWPYEGRPNVIGKIKGGEGKSILLIGHIDVVSPEPVQMWEHNPWEGIIEGNRLYGRGSFDMKAGICAQLYALKSLRDAGVKPGGNVTVASTIEEEAGGAGGALALLMKGYRADALMTNEPMPNIAVCHPGILYFRVNVRGKTAHAAQSHLGINAIGKMIKIYQALEILDLNRAARLSFPMIEKDSGRSCNMNLATIKAGDWVSTVPGLAELQCRISFVAEETESQVKAEIENTIREVANTDEWLRQYPPEVEWFGWHAEPWAQDENHPFVSLVQDTAKEVLGSPVELVGKPGGMDTRFSSFFNMPALSIGARGDRGHGFDEYVELDSVLDTAKIVALTILDWCK